MPNKFEPTLFANNPIGLVTKKPSLAVMQFKNLDGQNAAKHFVERVAEDLI